MNEDRNTIGVDSSSEEFVSTNTNSTNKTIEPPEYKGGDYGDPRYIPYFLETLKDNFAFSSLLVSVVGYIVIAAFGAMDSIGKYVGYIFFLLMSFVLYKISDKDIISKKVNSFFIWSFFIFAIIVICQNIDYIKLFLNYSNTWF